MKVLMKEPGKAPRMMDIDGSLRTLQNLVGGNIEHVGLTSRCGLLCDENGKLYGREPNFFVARINDVIVGNAVFVGEDGEDFTDIKDEDAAVIFNWLDVLNRLEES